MFEVGGNTCRNGLELAIQFNVECKFKKKCFPYLLGLNIYFVCKREKTMTLKYVQIIKVLNVQKTDYMLIGFRQKLSNLSNLSEIKVSIGNNEVERVSSSKTL